MTLTTICLYIGTCFAVTVTPGPTMLLALANGTSRCWRIAGMGILGAALSDLLLIGSVSLGLGALLATSETIFSTVKWVGVLYLVWLAIQLWLQQPAALKSSISTSEIRFLDKRFGDSGLRFRTLVSARFSNASEPNIYRD